jgi:hypothetical protein
MLEKVKLCDIASNTAESEFKTLWLLVSVLMVDNWCRCGELDSALVACQGVQDALANLENWLNSTDKELANIMKPASLIRERLDEQIRQTISQRNHVKIYYIITGIK